MILRCAVCREKIARFDEKTIHLPLTLEQFRPIAEGRSHHHPFRGDDPTWWICPICRKRPFNTPKRLYTEIGYVDVPEGAKDEPDGAVVSQDGDNIVVDEKHIGSKFDDFIKEDEIAIPEPTTFPKHMCKICGKVCDSEIELIDHMVKEHKSVCPKCLHKCGGRIGLISHMRHKHK